MWARSEGFPSSLTKESMNVVRLPENKGVLEAELGLWSERYFAALKSSQLLKCNFGPQSLGR